MPPPLSMTVTDARPSTTDAATVIGDPGGVCWMALRSRFEMARDSSRGSACTTAFAAEAGLDADLASARNGAQIRDGVGDHVVERHVLQRETQRAGVDLGQFEQVVDHRREPGDLLAHLPVVSLRIGRELVLQRLRHRHDAGQRSAQVMRDPRDEFATGLLDALLALPRLGELRAGGDQLVGERPELGAGLWADGIHALSLADAARRPRERTGVAHDDDAEAGHERSETMPEITATLTATVKSCGGEVHQPRRTDHAEDHREHSGEDQHAHLHDQRRLGAARSSTTNATPPTTIVIARDNARDLRAGQASSSASSPISRR